MSKDFITVTSSEVPEQMRKIFHKFAVEKSPTMKMLGTKFDGEYRVNLSKLEEEICSAYDRQPATEGAERCYTHPELDKILDGWCYLHLNRIKHLAEMKEELKERIKDYKIPKEDILTMVESLYRK